MSAPKIIGTADWAMVEQSVQTLVSTDQLTDFILNIYCKKAVFPRIGITTLPAKDFYWELVKETKAVEKCAFISMHQWSAIDKDKWNNLMMDYENPVVVRMWLDSKHPKQIKTMFEHKGSRSNVYTFNMCPVSGDAFLIFLTSIGKFTSKHRTHGQGPLAFMTVTDYLEEYGKRMVNALAAQRTGSHFTICIACRDAQSTTVLWPCGHAAFCATCFKKFKANKCPMCMGILNLDLLCASQNFVIPPDGDRCLVCAPSMNCTKMNCMLQHCGCVVGCMDYTERSLVPHEDVCPNCGNEIVRLTKVFVQNEGKE